MWVSGQLTCTSTNTTGSEVNNYASYNSYYISNHMVQIRDHMESKPVSLKLLLLGHLVDDFLKKILSVSTCIKFRI